MATENQGYEHVAEQEKASLPAGPMGRSAAPPPFQLQASEGFGAGENLDQEAEELAGQDIDWGAAIFAGQSEDEAETEGSAPEETEDLDLEEDLAEHADTEMEASPEGETIPETVDREALWSEVFGAEETEPEATSGEAPVQRVSKTDFWGNQKAIYEANNTGTERLAGDAEWLAMRRFCIRVTPTAKDTVRDVLNKAAKLKGLTFDEWKGSQKTGDSQEAQHLISSNYATKTLKLPYSQVNNPLNGKMLLAGRKGLGTKMPGKYVAAKKKRGKTVSRGVLHIKKGYTHNKYDKKMKLWIAAYYLKHKLSVGNPLPQKHFVAITKYLRAKHKALDGKANPQGLGVDDLNI